MYDFEMSVSRSSQVRPHIHTFQLSKSQIITILEGGEVDLTTSTSVSHYHNIRLWYNNNQKRSEWFFVRWNVYFPCCTCCHAVHNEFLFGHVNIFGILQLMGCLSVFQEGRTPPSSSWHIGLISSHCHPLFTMLHRNVKSECTPIICLVSGYMLMLPSRACDQICVANVWWLVTSLSNLVSRRVYLRCKDGTESIRVHSTTRNNVPPHHVWNICPS